MKHAFSTHRQRGLTFFGLLFVLILGGSLVLVGLKTLPALVEYQAILKAVERAKDKETVADIQRAFTASSAIDDFKAIESKDLDISKVNDKVKIRFAYDKEIVLAGPVSLLIHFKGESK